MIKLLSSWQGILAAALIAAVLVGWTGWTANGWRLNAKIDELKREYSEKVSEATAQARLTEQRRWRERDALLEQNEEEVKRLQAIINNERSTSKRLREQVAEYVQRARDTAHTEPGQGQPDSDPLGVLANVLTGIDRSASDVAEYADRLRQAGLVCEKLYDEL